MQGAFIIGRLLIYGIREGAKNVLGSWRKAWAVQWAGWDFLAELQKFLPGYACSVAMSLVVQ